jgi:carbon storage regulator
MAGLTLTRRLNESILIGDGIRVSVVRIEGCQVRLQIVAPKDVVILRDELARDDDARRANNTTTPEN